MAITTGTKTPLILSASFCIGGFSACAVCTIFKMLESTVSFPVAVTCAFITPVSRILPPIKKSFFVFETGILSPVMMDSFAEQSPHKILQSIGTCSPVFIKIKSPTRS